LIAILVSIALIIFIVEAQIPLPIPIPGVKLGLANVVTLFALFYNRAKRESRASVLVQKIDADLLTRTPNLQISFTNIDVFAILLCRIILGAVFTGRLVAFAYSITGGILGFAAQIVMRRFVSDKQIWVCGAIGAVFHNVGQIFAAAIITGTPAIIGYLPILVIAGVITGVLTGLIAQLTLERFPGRS